MQSNATGDLLAFFRISDRLAVVLSICHVLCTIQSVVSTQAILMMSSSSFRKRNLSFCDRPRPLCYYIRPVI